MQEWSYIPVGGNLPLTTQRQLGFGAAASMVHPATGKWYVSVLCLQMLAERTYDLKTFKSQTCGFLDQIVRYLKIQ